jgi:hypothetical protein
VTDQISPSQQAAKLRSMASELAGPDRDYHLWLASEWDKTAARYEGCRAGAKPARLAEAPAS